MRNLIENIYESIILEKMHTLLSKNEMEEYSQEVYNMVVKAYAYIGGIAGCNNFNSFKQQYVNCAEEDKLIWKVVKRGERITAVIIYTAKRGGRKSMLMASDGTERGKLDIAMLVYEDFKLKNRRAWSEQSGKALGYSLSKGKCIVPNNIITILMADKYAAGEIKLLDDGFFYLRKIAGKWHCKAMVGNPPVGEAIQLTDNEVTKFKELSKKYQEKYEGTTL